MHHITHGSLPIGLYFHNLALSKKKAHFDRLSQAQMLKASSVSIVLRLRSEIIYLEEIH